MHEKKEAKNDVSKINNVGLIMCSLPCEFEKKPCQDKPTQATMIKMGTK